MLGLVEAGRSIKGWINNPEGRCYSREVLGDDGGGGQKL